MNHIEGKLLVGAPNSIERYKNAASVCEGCFNRSPIALEFRDFEVGKVNGEIGQYILKPITKTGQCYVCELEHVTLLKIETTTPPASEIEI